MMPGRNLDRGIRLAILSKLKAFECVVLIGPRQIGKSTLVHDIIEGDEYAVYLDLDDPEDREKVGNGVDFFKQNKNALIVLDEIQRCPHLFSSLKAHIDRQKRLRSESGGRFLLLGSVSLDLQQHAASLLTGRYTELQMTGLLPTELRPEMQTLAEAEEITNQSTGTNAQSPVSENRVSLDQVKKLWSRGGLPASYLAENDELSAEYRRSFLNSYLNYDIKDLGLDVDHLLLTRCLDLISALNGTEFSTQKFAQRLQTDIKSINLCLDALQRLLIIRRLEPWSENLKTRVTHKPKIYIRDSGLLHSRLGLDTITAVSNYSGSGESWEGFVIEALIGVAINSGSYRGGYFFRNQDGDELDFILHRGGDKKWGFEIKCEKAKISDGNIRAANLAQVDRRLLVHMGEESFRTQKGNFEALSLMDALAIVAS